MPAFWQMSRPTIPSILFLGSCISLFGFMGMAMGLRGARRTAPFVVPTVLLLAAYMSLTMGGPREFDTWFLLVFLGALVVTTVAAPLTVARRWIQAELVNELTDQPGGVQREALQFRLGHLFALTTVVAVLSILGKFVWTRLDFSGANEWTLIFKLGISLGLCSLVVTWSTLGRDALARTLVASVLAVGLAALNYAIIRVEDGWIWLTMTLIVWSETTVLMWLCRLEGLRFLRSARES